MGPVGVEAEAVVEGVGAEEVAVARRRLLPAR
jgi:hypothetical protein